MSNLSRRRIAQNAAMRIADGESKAAVLKEIAAYLIDSNRKRECELIARDIETALIDRGIIIGTIVSARKLSTSAKEAIDSFVKHHYHNVSTVVLRERVDE